MYRTDQIGAPGIYFTRPLQNRSIVQERMDVCGFVGVSPRGPSRAADLPEWWRREDGSYVRQWREGAFPTQRTVPVPVNSFDDYLRLFGGFDGPGRLAYAVAMFFEQGGQRAWISRIVHQYINKEDNSFGSALGIVDGVSPVNGANFSFRARNEGLWGNKLRAAIGFSSRPLQFKKVGLKQIVFDIDENVSVGSLFRIRFPGNVFQLRFVDSLQVEKTGNRLDKIVEFNVDFPAIPEALQLIEGILKFDDGEGVQEVFNGLGLSSRHPRWLGTVICYDSQLIYPEPEWSDTDLMPLEVDKLPRQAVLPPIPDDPADWVTQDLSISGGHTPQFTGGEERYSGLVFDDFFDSDWVYANPDPGSGIHAFAYHPEIATLIVPDLYCPEPIPEKQDISDPVSLATAEFKECFDLPEANPPEENPPDPYPLCLDPGVADDREKIITLQKQLVDFAETIRDFVVLLDVPPGLNESEIFAWRSHFNSSFAAAYLPWIKISRREDAADSLILLNPSTAAAGILAQTEIQFGVPHGPANKIAFTAVNTEIKISENQHDKFHPLGLNVFAKEPNGIRLTAARTLSADSSLRQLSVRRLMILLKRVLEKQMHWMVFEPNHPRLWRQVKHMLNNYLNELYRSGAFTGSTEEEAFFVRCDERNNPPSVVDQGKLIVEIGVAPAEPLEFIVLKITRDGDSTLVSEL